MKKLIYILGVTILCVASSLVTFFTLNSMHIIDLKEKIDIEVAIEDIAKEYDGTALTADHYSYTGDLKEGHILDVDYLGSQLDVGTTSSTANVRVLDESTGADVSELYELSVKPGILQVVPREIKIVFDYDMEYVGSTIDELDYKISNGSLAVGDELVVQYTGKVSEIGSLYMSNEVLNILVYNSVGHNVTSNYHISYQVKNLNILKRDLVIQPYPLQKVYDGQKFKVDSYEIIAGSLLDGHRIEKVEYNLETDNAGHYFEQTISVEIKDLSGNDVTAYYNINPSLTFELDIFKQNVEVELPKLTFASKKDAKAGYNEVLNKLSNLDGVYFSLVSEFVLEENRSIQEITDKDITIGGTESNNYYFQFTNGQIEIKQEIALPQISFTYTGSNLNELYNNQIPNVEGLTIRLVENRQYVDVGTYEITEKDLEIDGNSEGVHFTNGAITIIPKEVSFGNDDIQHMYNGSYFEIKNNELKLISNEQVMENYFVKNVVLDSYEITEERLLKSFTAKILDYQIFNAVGKNVTSNFMVSSNIVFCKFLKCDLKLQMKAISGIYYETKNYQFSDLISDDYKNYIGQGDYVPSVTIPIQFIETTTLESIQTILKDQMKIMNAASGKDVTFAYNLEVLKDQAQFNIEKRAAKIILPSYQGNYDGKVHTFDDITIGNIQYVGFVNEDEPKITSTEEWLNAGTYSYSCSYDAKYDSNYDITIVPGTVTITKLKAQVILPNYEKTYDGTALTFANVPAEKIKYAGFLKDDYPTITCADQWDAVGTYSYVGTWETKYDVNYDITMVPGTITITRKKAQITLPNYEKEYDGTALTFANIPANKIVYSGFLKDDLPTITCADQWDAVGMYSYIGTWGTDYDAKYDITIVPGTITITRKKAQIILPNLEKEYDGTILTFANIPTDKIGYTGFLKDDCPNSTNLTCFDQWLDAGSYSYTCQWSSNYNKNYEITVIPGEINITKATVSIDASSPITHIYNGSYYEVYDDEISFLAGGKKYYLRNVSIETETKINYLSTMTVKFTTTGYSIYNSNGEDVTKNFNTTNFDLSLRFKAKAVNFYISDFNVGTYGDDITISPVTLLKGFENNLFKSEYLEIAEFTDFTMDWTTCTIMNLADLSSCISISAQFSELTQDISVDGVYDITIVNEETFKPTFNKRRAQIVFGDYEMKYTGTPITYADIASRTYCRGFLAEDLPTFTCSDTWKDVGTYQYYCSWNENLDLYYDISVTVGTIKITN